jgi:hypothetical protein
MSSLPVIVAAFALVVPAPLATLAPQSMHETHLSSFAGKFGSVRQELDPFRDFRDSYRPQVQDQVRIEQHVIIRITPSPRSIRRDLLAPPPNADDPPFREKKADHCVRIEDIEGIAPMQPNRLVLFMRNHHMLSASLERACDADAFYLGAYVERSADGRLCTGRDMLRARTGATCQITRFSRLVAAKN